MTRIVADFCFCFIRVNPRDPCHLRSKKALVDFFHDGEAKIF